MPFDATPEVKIDHPVVETLKRAKFLISDPERWCKDAETQVKDGIVQLCSIGALYRVAGKGNDRALYAHVWLDRATSRHTSHYSSIVDCNDASEITHAKLMEVWDEAIMLAEQEYT